MGSNHLIISYLWRLQSALLHFNAAQILRAIVLFHDTGLLCRSTNSPACFQLYLTSYIWSIVIQSTKPRTIKRLLTVCCYMLTVCCYMLTTSCLSGRKRTRSVFTSANIWLLILILTLDHVLIVPQLLQNEIKLVGCCVGLYNWKCIGINVWWMSFIHSGSFRGSLHQQDGHQTAQISYN